MEARATPHLSGVRDRLVADHRRLEDLLQRTLSAVEADDREAVAEAFTELDSRLRTHLEAEERHLLPAFQRSDPRACRAILEEHKLIRARLLELGTAVDLHTLRFENVRTFAAELRAHANHEDKVFYKWADANVGEKERALVLSALIYKVMSRVRSPRGSPESKVP